jgi:hypothetical protein
LTTVIQNSITGTDVPVVTKKASVGIEADGDDVLPLDLDGPPTLVVYAVQLKTRLQSQLYLDRRCSLRKYIFVF